LKIIGKAEQKKIDLQIANLQHKVAELEKLLSAAQTAHQKQEAAAKQAQADAKAQLEAKVKQLDAKAKKLFDAQAATAKAKQEGDTAAQATKAEADKTKQTPDAANKALADTKAQLDAKTKELANLQAAAAKAKQEGDKATQAARAEIDKTKQAAETQAKELTALKAERDKQAKLAQQTEAKYQDSAQENELLLLQLMQAQEELVEYYEQKGEFEKLYLAYKARWERLEKRLPSYLDFGAIEIVDVDGLSDVPSITWQVKDFAQAGMALSEFSFVTVLQDGHPGIGLVKDGQPHAFVPKLLGTNKDHLAIFLGLGTTEFKQLTAAVSILDQLEAGRWNGFEFPAQFDLSFWRPSLQTLLAQFKQLPALLRYDEVRLKRELINPDYEHLWLEFRGLSLGAAQWKKFEIRLGAALVQADGFSQFPKFEIPLIDGKTKPFDSWYAESQDDSGAKLELRFALDKNVFDVAAWAKLTDADKVLLLRLIYGMPDALKRLEQQKTAIHRPWATWIEFATGAVKVLEVNKAAATLPAPASGPAPADQTKLPAPAKVTSTGAKAGKVISITTKPVPTPATKPNAKSAGTKTSVKPDAKTSKVAAKTGATTKTKTVRKTKA